MFPNLTKVSVTVNGLPIMLCKNGMESMGMWETVSHFFMKQKIKLST